MIFKRRLAVKYLIAFIIAVVIYGEWLVYSLQRFHWYNLDCRDANSCTKILFIADPQIQGDFAVPPPLNYIFNWDSDRYVQQTFLTAYHHFKPDMLVYLGDLMDEGSVATMIQFHAYVKRLFTIFEVPHDIVQVWIPGDNDIGGEQEPIKRDKIVEFHKVFDQPDVITYNNVSIYKVNRITHAMPEIPDDMKNDGDFKIVVSHYPTMLTNSFAATMNELIRPDVYFCAHEHSSKYMKISKDLSTRSVHRIGAGDILTISVRDEDFYEIYVPTCSYRMGTSNIGFGAAILENNNEVMQYTVFWSPRRFPLLYTYLVVGISIFICLLVVFMIKLYFYLISKKTIQGSLKVPLLKNSV